ncbi:helix-turn-helix domain-containing protein [Cohnella yongneupensis]|uniref:Helix-turn-helix domain-containing protein n=1 Tax=Cohnella yongneupensis TaxID=425006 RepID=A0ABW0QWE4_9BACL
MSILSERLKQARIRMGKHVTQMVVSKATGVHDRTLGGYENSRGEPDSETLLVLANYYGVTTDYLLGNTNNPLSTLSEEHRSASKKVNIDDDSFLDLPFVVNGRELTREEKVRLQSVARAMLQ